MEILTVFSVIGLMVLPSVIIFPVWFMIPKKYRDIILHWLESNCDYSLIARLREERNA